MTDDDDKYCGVQDERIAIKISRLRNQSKGNWEFSALNGDIELTLGWCDTFDEAITELKKVMAKHSLPVGEL